MFEINAGWKHMYKYRTCSWGFIKVGDMQTNQPMPGYEIKCIPCHPDIIFRPYGFHQNGIIVKFEKAGLIFL